MGVEPLLGVRDDLRIAARHVQHDGIICAGDFAAHLDVADTVVDAHERLVPQQAQGAGGDGDGLQRRAHPGALGVAYAVDICEDRKSVV